MLSGGGETASSGGGSGKRRVSYFYEPTIGDYYYGQGHPMKPHRIRMAHNLVVHYGLYRLMEVCRPFPATADDICRFHSEDYVQFLSSVSPAILAQLQQQQAAQPTTTTTLAGETSARQLKRFNVGEDCPVFEGLFDFCQASAGGSIGAAVKLNRGDADIAINWAGGLHHAKKCEASGFCYVNDIVLGILELLKFHRRFGRFGCLNQPICRDHGDLILQNPSSPPLNDGIDDESFQRLFRTILQKVMEVYQPDAIVLQCGADSLAGDRLGCFNLSLKGHADCLRYLRSFNIPLMVLGGGGYTIRNVARCWCYETAVAVGVEPDNNLPYNEYYEYFGPDYNLHIQPDNTENKNSLKDLEGIRNKVMQHLSQLEHVPSVQFQSRPPDTEVPEENDEDMERRGPPKIWDGASYDSEPEEVQDRHINEDHQIPTDSDLQDKPE